MGRIDALSSRYTTFEDFVDTSITSLESKVKMNTDCTVELHDIAVKTREYVDEKFSKVSSVVATIVHDSEVKTQAKIEGHCKELVEPYRGDICLLKKRAVETSESLISIRDKFSSRMTQIENRQNADFLGLNEKLEKLKLELSNHQLQAELNVYKGKVDALEATQSRQHRELSLKLDGALETIETLNNRSAPQAEHEGGAGGSSNNTIPQPEWQQQRERIEHAHDLITGLRGDVDLNTKRSKAADVNARKNNVIIDKLGEIDKENAEARINGILNNTLTQNDRKEVVIVRAFRLGRRTNSENNG